MKKILLAVALITLGSLKSQNQAEVSLELLDGNLIKGVTSLPDIELLTAYGKLTIPVSKVGRIEIGLFRDAGTTEKAKSFLKILATSSNESQRKSAHADLIKLGLKAVPAIQDFLNDPKNIIDEATNTSEYSIENALSDLKSTYGISDATPSEDILSIDNVYIMGGTYNFTKLDVKTEYGTLTVPKEKIKSIDISVSNSSSGEASFKLNASKHISGNQNGGWLKTGIMLKTGQKFSITAGGEITLASLSGNKYKPDGSVKSTGSNEYTGGNPSKETEDINTYPTFGQVVYRIGESGEASKAGAKYSGSAKKAGALYISIYETVYNSANSGSYTVKISIK
ncbi:MAG: hypothetical protein JSU07_07465 [Bacteroidetes bacterium]|nr:hypothetical protein [Bacteroidota bacterium]